MVKSRSKVSLLNFEGGSLILLLNFEGWSQVPLLNFEGGPGSHGPQVPGPKVLVPLLHHGLLLYNDITVEKIHLLTYRLYLVLYSKISTKNYENFRFLYISLLFEQKELKLLSRQKFIFHDSLPLGLLKDCGSIISKPLHHIINLSIRSGKFPSSWKAAKVTSIFMS